MAIDGWGSSKQEGKVERWRLWEWGEFLTIVITDLQFGRHFILCEKEVELEMIDYLFCWL